MFRRYKKITAFVTVLLLGALQFHSVLHLLGHDEHARETAPCAACEISLAQTAIHTPCAAPEIQAVLGLACLEISIPCQTPQFRGFSPSLRAPPTVS